MGALPNVASSRRYHRTDWRKEKWLQGAKLGLDGRDRITEGWVSTSVILQDHNLAKVGVEGSNPFARSRFPQGNQSVMRRPPRGGLSRFCDGVHMVSTTTFAPTR
jgi:hypothetical protein